MATETSPPQTPAKFESNSDVVNSSLSDSSDALTPTTVTLNCLQSLCFAGRIPSSVLLSSVGSLANDLKKTCLSDHGYKTALTCVIRLPPIIQNPIT
ncbi:hypothetical protein O181_072131 [Austropuccinia psidii MF-1]|uniref:Uncharacterized protein n=1 Tax=Austropuccinia psidii MF-1 TaxID=1389203 RepID=A0A9Q3F8L8_9BASI|nr:hypothetical protein [Austropuccinia psidii MF-1]